MSDPCEPIAAGDSGRVEGYAHGGHITRWWPSGSETSRLWVSQATDCGPGTAIRGGVPVIFPQFGLLGDLPKHGYARNRAWTRLVGGGGSDGVLAFETLIEDEPDWPGRVRLELGALAVGNHLIIRFGVANVGETPTPFTAALHTYLTVTDSETAGIVGLGDAAASDSPAGGAPVTLPSGRLPTAGPQDLMVRGVPGPIVLQDAELPELEMVTTGFPDWVVWNPGSGHGLPDVVDGDERQFVCIEPALLDPVTIQPGERWEGSLSIRQEH